MDPVQALILKLMESQAAQGRNAMNPTSDPGGLQGAQPQPGGAQPGPVGTGPMSPDDLIAQMLQGR